jgi:essential nuclear protein 1
LNDRAALDNLHPANVGERKTLADVIFAQLNNANPEIRTVRIAGPRMAAPRPLLCYFLIFISCAEAEPEAPDPAAGLDPRIVETYTKSASTLLHHTCQPIACLESRSYFNDIVQDPFPKYLKLFPLFQLGLASLL